MKDDIIRFILDSAVRGGAAGASIRAVHVSLGELADFGEAEFGARWRELARGTAAEHAELQLRMERAELQCMVCFQKYHPEAGITLCPFCGSVGAKVLQGEQCKLELVELNDE